MTVTRETLELAAKAAGVFDQLVWSDRFGVFEYKHCQDNWWSPITDHGQLLDLAMACKICIDPMMDAIFYEAAGKPEANSVNCQDFHALAEAVIQAAAEQQMAKEGA